MEKIAGVQEQIDYVRCMINDNYDPPKAAQRCSRELDVDLDEIREVFIDSTQIMAILNT